MFFIVTTGRSGSTSLAEILDQHPLCHARHEPHPLLIKLAAEYLHKDISDYELGAYLFQGCRLFPHRVKGRLYGESDQKLSFMIPVLAKLGGNTKFIWLIRDGRKVVASTFARNWYHSSETDDQGNLWAKYRIRGDRSGDMSVEQWANMSAFEKCCWYWSYTNRVIQQDIQKLSKTQWMMIRVEELDAEFPNLLHFLNLPYFPLKVIRTNESKESYPSAGNWTSAHTEAFDFWAGSEMDRWYPTWRQGGTTIGDSHESNKIVAADYLHSTSHHVLWFMKMIGAKVASKFR